MNKILRLFAFLVLFSGITFAQTGVFFSEYIEGGSNNKSLEIFNGTGSDIDLANYRVVLAANGAATPGTTFALTGTLVAGDVYVISNSASVTAILDTTDVTSTVTYFNGDDYIGLQFNNAGDWITIDGVGVLGTDTGAAWDVAGTVGATVNHTLVRKSSVVTGNPVWALSAGTTVEDSEWEVYAQDEFTYLGSHTMIPVVSLDLNITFEDASEVTKWSHWDEANLYTTEAHDATGGVDGTGALKLGDAGYGMVDKRKVYVTTGKYFSLNVDIKTQGWATPETYKLFLNVEGFATAEPVQINSDSGFTTFNIVALATADSGYVRIAGMNTLLQNYIWIDNLILATDVPRPIDPLPTVASKPSPLDGDTLISPSTELKVMLGWGYHHDVFFTEPDSFKVLFDTDGAFGSPETYKYAHVSGNSDYYSTIEVTVDFGTTYYWQVIPFNTSGEATGNTTWSFQTIAGPEPPKVFFSEYIEGSSNNKAFEIFNGENSDVDLGQFRVIRVNNGGLLLSDSLVLSGTLAAGDVFVIGNSSAVSQILDASDITSTLTYYNGDDYMGLQYYSSKWETIDAIGIYGNDPGTGWSVAGVLNGTAEHTLVRKETVTEGNPDWTVSAGTTVEDSEWEVYAQDFFDSLGSHTMIPAIDFNITDVVITNLNATQTKIEWKTTQPASGFIFYAKEDTTNGFPMEAMESGGLVTEHSLTLDTLTTGLTYYFIIDQNDAEFNNVRSGAYSFIAGDVDSLLVPPYYLAGDFQGWNPSSTPIYDDGTNGDLVAEDGIYSLEFSIATSGFHGWKVTNGTWDVTWPASDSWFSSTTDPQTVLFTFNTNSVGDGWFPDQYIVNTNEAKPTALVAVGDFQSEEGESGDWINNSTITAMHDDGLDGDLLSGDGIFCYHMKSLPIGSYSAKGVKAGEWNGWGTDGRSQDAKNINFTTTIENQDVYLYVNVNTGRTFLSFEAIEPFVAPKIFFSEYIEGSSNNKALEVYNGGETELDLNQFVILIGGNGSKWFTSHSFPVDAKLAAGDVWVMVADQVSAALYDTSKADEVIPYSTSSPVHYNGDDARAIAMIVGADTTLIDVIGLAEGVDPGTGWNVAGVLNATVDHSLVRKETVSQGNTDWLVAADSTADGSEWIVYDKDTFKYLGQHPGEEVVVVTEPLVAAPTPLVDSSNVISLFSNAYNNVVVDTWSTSWDVADVADFVVEGNDTKLYTNVVYAGIETTSQVIDASEMTHFHMDIWTPDTTAEPNVFKIKLVDFGADGAWSGGDDVEHEVTLSASTTPALATGEWVSIDLPLSDFTALTTKEHMAQYIISGNLKTVYVDNMYFYKAANAILYSNFETGLGDWTPRSVASTKDWLQATGTGALGTTAFAQANGYGEEAPSNDYLIAGPFNLNNFTEEYMDFWSAAKYGKVDTELTLEYSTNYDGSADPSSFTWTALNFTLPVDLNDTWTYSGKIDLSTINSDVVYIAFHYLSNGTDIGRKKIDEVGIYGTPEQGVDLPPVVESVNRTVVIPNANQDTEVTATVSDDKGVSAVSLVYSNDGTNFSYVPMSNTTGNTWVGNVPEALYNDGDLFGYLVAAMDNSGQTDTSDITMLFAGNTRIENIKMLTDGGSLEFKNVMAKVTGTVSAGSGTYSTGRIEAYMQDSTAGVLVIAFGTETPAMVEGNNYTVTGKIIQYNGLVEIEPVTPASDIVDNGTSTSVVPMVVTISNINNDPEQFEGSLVKIEFAELSSTTPWLAGSTSGSTMKIFVGTDTLDLRVDADTDIWGTDAPTFPQDIIGVLGQYDSSKPYTSGYQLLPRRLADFDASVGVDDQNGIPTVYDLSQNYPNPFNPSTKIKFSLPENGMVTLKLYDILGREVATLINEELPASYQTVDFNASNLSTGIYFYRLQVNEFTSVKKMILMK